MPAKKTTKKRTMSDEHKAALAEGRELSRAVRLYLDALEAHRPKRGRKRTPESIEARLATLDAKIEVAEPLQKLTLVQERIDLAKELDAMENTVDPASFESGFVNAAARYSELKGISYAAWREVGVPAAVLRDAGVSRSA